MRHTTHRRAALVLLVLTAGCGLDGVGPNQPRPGQFQLVPYVDESMPSGLVPLDRAGILIVAKGRDDVVLDTVIKIKASDSTLALNLPVPVLGPADTMQASIALITAAGDTAFRGGPIDVVAEARSVRAGIPNLIQLRYTGVGAGADSVVIVSHPAAMFSGDTATFTAVAYKNNLPVPGTPIAWVSLDQAHATVPSPSKGTIRATGSRGSARVMAQLLDGPADTATVAVDLPPALIQLRSGNLQIARVSSPLPLPVEIKLTALDGVAIPGIWIRFSSINGGVFSSDSVRTDSAGIASVRWTLGSASGVQTADVSTVGWTSVKQTVIATSVPQAVSVLWTAASGGLWSVASNWSTGLLPGPLDTVIISLGGTYTVTVDQVVNVAGLLVGSVTGSPSLLSNGQNIYVNGTASIAQNGVLGVSGAILSAAGGITNAGTLKLLNGTVASDLSNNGTVLVKAPSTISGALTNSGILDLQTGNLNVTGAMNLFGGSVTNIYVTSATQYTQLIGGGAAALAGELHMDFSAHQPGLLETYTPVIYGSHTGNFSQNTGLGLGGLLLNLTAGLTSLLVAFL